MNDNTAILSEKLAHRGGWLDSSALIDERTGERYRHQDVHSIARYLADKFAESGVGTGDHIGFAVGDRLEWHPAFLALHLIGAVPLVLNPDLTWRAQSRQLTVLSASFLLAHQSGELCLRSMPTMKLLRSWKRSTLTEVGKSSGEHLNDFRMPDVSVFGPSRYYLYSSGSTGSPKAVEHTSDDLPIFHDAVGGSSCLDIQADDTIVSLSQYYFTYGFSNQFVYPLFSGASVVLNSERRSADEFAQCLDRYDASLAFSVPSALSMLADHIDENAIEAPPSLRAIVSAGEPLPVSLARRFENLWGIPVLGQIGSTEVGNAFCANGKELRSEGSAGFVRPGYRVELRPVEDASIRMVGGRHEDHEIGAVWVSGPTIPAAAATVDGRRELLAGGWLETRDYGYWDEHGALVVLGRIDDFVHVGGISISAIEIESAIREFDHVWDCAVRSSWVEGVSTLVALIVSDVAGVEPDDHFDTMRYELRERLEPFQIPKRWIPVEAVPRTASGKIIRHRCDAIIDEKF
ncbi:class I adenylate-forming enzyme family protein [Actinopolyspora mortivallis]|uniref:class I adenylate-forming enzyme family protein n=1 Tax=Actinopolyspora mortivallis TaxID=33906 RepID=UPI0003AA7586|nr:class I adenylate-forming enzyme family protein [Actinopolyspora mortivallis]